MDTKQFVETISKLDIEKNTLNIFDVDFDENAFESLLHQSETHRIVANTDGPISHVFEDVQACEGDNSRTTKCFGLHSDGIYLDYPPRMVILYAVNPGTSGIPTIFADSRELIERLKNESLYDEAKEYNFVYTKSSGPLAGKKFTRPLIEKDPGTGDEVMHVVMASPAIELVPKAQSKKTKADAEKFIQRLTEISNKEIHLRVHNWKQGQVVVFNNSRLVHGRDIPENFHNPTVDMKRELVRIWVDKK